MLCLCLVFHAGTGAQVVHGSILSGMFVSCKTAIRGTCRLRLTGSSSSWEGHRPACVHSCSSSHHCQRRPLCTARRLAQGVPAAVGRAPHPPRWLCDAVADAAAPWTTIPGAPAPTRCSASAARSLALSCSHPGEVAVNCPAAAALRLPPAPGGPQLTQQQGSCRVQPSRSRSRRLEARRGDGDQTLCRSSRHCQFRQTLGQAQRSDRPASRLWRPMTMASAAAAPLVRTHGAQLPSRQPQQGAERVSPQRAVLRLPPRRWRTSGSGGGRPRVSRVQTAAAQQSHLHCLSLPLGSLRAGSSRRSRRSLTLGTPPCSCLLQ